MIAIIGLGNILMGDDGIGCHIAKKLMEENLENVEIIEAGTSLIKILPQLTKYDKIIFIDAIKGEKPPGEIYIIEPKPSQVIPERAISLHEINLNSLIQMKEKLGIKAKIIIVGIQPAQIKPTLNLSKEVEKVIPKVIKIIERIVKNQ